MQRIWGPDRPCRLGCWGRRGWGRGWGHVGAEARHHFVLPTQGGGFVAGEGQSPGFPGSVAHPAGELEGVAMHGHAAAHRRSAAFHCCGAHVALGQPPAGPVVAADAKHTPARCLETADFLQQGLLAGSGCLAVIRGSWFRGGWSWGCGGTTWLSLDRCHAHRLQSQTEGQQQRQQRNSPQAPSLKAGW